MLSRTGLNVEEITAEFDGASLGDARLDDRLRRIVAMASVAPSDSFPDQMESVADREALYRFLANPKVTMRSVLQGHVEQTHARIQTRSVVRVVHDTTTFRFSGERAGLGLIRGGAKGFLGHVALAVAPDETREPLGVLGVHPFIHRDAMAHCGMTRAQRVAASRSKPREARESSRWERLAMEVSGALPANVRAIHIMDQEADDYHLLAKLHQAGLGFVVRACPERRTMTAGERAKDVLAKKSATVFRAVRLTPRSGRKAVVSRSGHPARAERRATLQIRWDRITIKRERQAQSKVHELSFWAVHVFEPRPPRGEEPIEWMLFTSETVNTLADATDIVDHYRSRWIIEEYFKALKTGCSFEKRQLTTYEGLVRALAIFAPLAWRLLALRHLARASRPRPASGLLEDEQLLLLRTLLAKRRYALPVDPTVYDAMLGIAALGGHIKNNGDPGWLVIGRGFTRFVEAEAVWRLARQI